MTDLLKIIGIACVTLAFTVAAIFVARSLSATATPVRVFEAAKGITCVSMVTGDSVALSCLRDAK